MTTKREDRIIVKMSLKDRFGTVHFVSKQESQSQEKLFLVG